MVTALRLVFFLRINVVSREPTVWAAFPEAVERLADGRHHILKRRKPWLRRLTS